MNEEYDKHVESLGIERVPLVYNEANKVLELTVDDKNMNTRYDAPPIDERLHDTYQDIRALIVKLMFPNSQCIHDYPGSRYWKLSLIFPYLRSKNYEIIPCIHNIYRDKNAKHNVIYISVRLNTDDYGFDYELGGVIATYDNCNIKYCDLRATIDTVVGLDSTSGHIMPQTVRWYGLYQCGINTTRNISIEQNW